MATGDTRTRILHLIRRYPGLHLREVARQLKTSVALVEYHVPGLLENGVIERIEADGTHRLFPAHEGFPRLALASVREPKRLRIVLALLDQGPLRHGDLAAATGLGKSTLSFHLNRLRSAGVVEKTDQEFFLVDPGVMRRLLERHNPTPDVVDRLGTLWGDLYD